MGECHAMKAKIVPTYATQCFCKKPELPELGGIPYRPRFEFMQAVRQCAASIGVTAIKANTTTKSALGEMHVSCAHRQVQLVRFDWHIDYD